MIIYSCFTFAGHFCGHEVNAASHGPLGLSESSTIDNVSYLIF